MEFGILGRFELISDTGELIPIGGRLVRGLIFALTLYRNETLSSERLIDLLWGPDTDRLQSLRSCLWGARKAMPAKRLVTTDLGYQLHIDPRRDHVDLDRFRRLHRQGREALGSHEHSAAVRLLDEAMALWGSGRTTDLLPATPAMASLLAGIEEERRDARTALFHVRLMLGAHRELLPELRTLVTAEPDDERLWGQLMLALHQCGLRADALQVFVEASSALALHAGAQPGPALCSLRQRIQANDPALMPGVSRTPSTGTADSHFDQIARRDAVPRQLPADLRDFVGRVEEAAELIGLLSPSEGDMAVPVVEVAGTPGIGKTALAVHVGHAVAHDYPDGQLYVRLAGTSAAPPTAAAVLGEILRTLGLHAAEIPETTHQRATVYRSRLAGRRMLVVLDDAASPEQVRPLIPGTAGCAVIVTSRPRLVGLAASGAVNLAPLQDVDALRLLARIVARERLDAEPDAAREIVRACAGLPLAVRIAAERLAARPTWPIVHLARALADQQRRLDELVAGDLAMRASIASSYQALSPEAQRLFRLLAFVGAHDVEGWVADVLVGEAAAGLVDTLVDHCLLSTSGVDALGEARYRFHDLLREYAAELLAADPEADAALERMVSAWTELAALAEVAVPRALYLPMTSRPPFPAIVVGEPVVRRVAAAPLDWFMAERVNLLTAVEKACAVGQYRQARELALRTAPYLHMQSYHDDAERMWTVVGEAAEEAGDVLFAARARMRVAVVVAADRGQHARAMPLIDQCIEAFRNAGDRQRLARAYGLRGYCARMRGRLLEARRDGERGLGLARESNDPHAEFFCLRMLAVTYGLLDAHQEGIACGEQAREIAHDLDPVAYQCAAIYTLVKARLLAGPPDQVIDLCEEGLSLSAESGHELIRAHFHQQMGLAYQQLHRHDDAIRALTTAADDFASRHDRYQCACCERALADSYLATGCNEKAIAQLERCREAFRALGVSDQEVEAKTTLTEYDGGAANGVQQ